MNHTDHIALSSIDHMVPYINSKMLPLSQIVERMGRSYADKQYNYYVHTWDDGPDITMVLLPPGGSTGKRNHIAICVLIVDGTPQPKLYYDDDVAGVRGRVAMEIDPG